MRYYWEALFSSEYFPYWEFTMVLILFLTISTILRLTRVERKVDEMHRSLVDMDEV